MLARSMLFNQALTTDHIVPDLVDSAPSIPPLARRNSTVSVTRPDTPPIDTLPPPLPVLQTLPPFVNQTDNLRNTHTSQSSNHYRAFVDARSSGDHEVALLAVNNFSANLAAKLVHVYEFNAALVALYHTRPRGSPLADIQDLYNTMISLGVHPNIIRTVPHKEHLQIQLFSSLLSCCAHRGVVDIAIMVWKIVEQHSLQPSAVLYKSMMQTFARVGKLSAAEDVSADFREQSAAGSIAWGSSGSQPSSRAAVRIWNVMMEAYFKCGKPDMAIELLQEMLKPRQSDTRPELPSPAPSTYTTIIAGFCNSGMTVVLYGSLLLLTSNIGDYQSARTWFNTLVTQPSSPGFSFDPSPLPSRPDALAYRVVLETLSQKTDALPAMNAV
ncbi:hypothetical protein HHX47_DHR3000158 [Lentinula edodes]|nr:hypothetical protein HHX47_DHR3000158 [Lentinula edodes]